MIRAFDRSPLFPQICATARRAERVFGAASPRALAATARRLRRLGILALFASAIAGAAEQKTPSEALYAYLHSGNGDAAEVAGFIARGADVNFQDPQDHVSPLHSAVHFKQVAAAKLLVERGADINARNGEGNTPLYVAVHQESLELTVYLLGKGADVNRRNDFGYSPLRQSCRWGNLDAVNLLLAKGADVNVQDGDGNTPLHIAVDEDNPAVARILIAHHAAVSVAGQYGDTPLHRAVAKGRTALVRLLVAAGADTTIKNQRGQTPLDLAILPFLDGNKEIIELLKSAGREKI
jgi:ankyrin repeat protein